MKKVFTVLMVCFAYVNVLFAQQGPIITEFSFRSPVIGSDSLEFIELYNPTNQVLNMRDYLLIVNNNNIMPFHQLHDVKLLPKEVLVLGMQGASMQTIYNMSFGHRFFVGSDVLPDQQGSIVLTDIDRNVVDSVYYNILQMPVADEDKSHSFVLCDLEADNANPSAWSLSSTAILNSDLSPRTINGKSLYASPGFLECLPNVIDFTPYPSNDFCMDAIELHPDTICLPIAGSINNATQEFAIHQCRNIHEHAAEVWYKFMATDTQATIHLAGIGYMDAVIELFSGSCNNLTVMKCVQETYVSPGNIDKEEILIANELEIGETYYIRVYDYYAPNAYGSDFEICLLAPSTINPCDTMDMTASFVHCENRIYAMIYGEMVPPYEVIWSDGSIGDSIAVDSIIGISSATIVTANGCTQFYDFIGNYNYMPCPHVNKLNDILKLQVVPNPAKTNAYLNLESTLPLQTMLSIYNVTGQLMHSESVFVEGTMAFVLNISDYQSGIYMIQLKNDYGTSTEKLIIME